MLTLRNSIQTQIVPEILNPTLLDVLFHPFLKLSQKLLNVGFDEG